MSFKDIVVLALVVITIVACHKPKIPQSTSLISLKSCVLAQQNSNTVIICLDSILQDSRCPKNVECFWAGIAVAKFTLRVNNEPHSFVLANYTAMGYASDTLIAGYKITFINLYPYPGDGTASPVKAEIKITP